MSRSGAALSPPAHQCGGGPRIHGGCVMKKMKLVVIGNGMAGIRTVEELIKLAPDLYEITVFGSEPYPYYNRILLSPVLTGEQTIQDIILNDMEWDRENGIRLHRDSTVTKIPRCRKVVWADDGTEVPDDRLLRAAGSNPFVLALPGHDLEGVGTCRAVRDVNQMSSAAARYKHAVVI